MKMSKDIVEQRRKKIMQKIQVQKNVNVEQLAKELNVTPLTIRRDLQYWEDKGALERYYGGARLVQSFVENDENNNEPYKHAIAKYAATFINDGDTIFINTSSTALLVIQYIIGKRVTVITNNGKAIFCEHDPLVEIVLTGGELRFPKETMTGDFALNNLRRVRANKAFLGCSGFDAEVGMSTAILQEVNVNETMISRCSGEAFILADATKINYVHQFVVAKPIAFSRLITDTRVPIEDINEFKDAGLYVYQLDVLLNYK